MKNLCFLLFVSLSLNLFSQSPGDTIKVNVFDYNSSTRDTIAQFPTNSSVSYQKVIMKYGMRCKGGRVSPPVAGQTNIGCGEWDYSCNTYITDSTRADSLNASTNKYQIVPDTNTSGSYSTTPTWEGFPQIQKATALLSVSNNDSAIVGTGLNVDSQLVRPNWNGKTFFLLTQSELVAGGLSAGNIHALALNNNNGMTSPVKQLRLRLKATSLTSLAIPDTSMLNSYQEVYFHNTDLLSGWNKLLFHTAFNWNGTSNILVELSYQGDVNGNSLELKSHTTTAELTAKTYNDNSFNLFQGNYIEAQNYFGISGNGTRTIEAWIKTTATNGEIVSWGRNSGGQKFSFRTEGSGRLRLEINGGYIIGTTPVNDGEWHHIVLAFAGSNINGTFFYIDGVRDLPSSTQNRPVNTGVSLPVQISKGFHNRYFSGEIDDLRIWSAFVPINRINQWKFKKLDSSHPNYASLELYYPVLNNGAQVFDESPNNRNANFNFVPSFNQLSGLDHFKSIESQTERPNIKLYQGVYSISVQNDTIIDTVATRPYTILERTIYSKAGTVRSDSVGEILINYWNSNNTLYDLNGNIAQQTPSASIVSLTNVTLPYINRSAMKLEIMSFVTPYGINLDLGLAGKAWYYDVTDFLPILNGNRRINLERGGQNQEEMDIDFFFIVGTPPRDVKDIKQIWRVDQRNYQQILSDEFYEPRTVPIDTSASQFKVRSVVTGHGQQGEFIGRNHYININGGAINFVKYVWKACANNPVYPQGGTWIYDRAGWCPGMATDVSEYDITNLVSGDTVNIDYGVQNGSGDSRYIVSNQLVSYGDENFQLDARLTEVERPNNHIEYGRSNPICEGARIRMQNSGATTITSATIEYWINNGIKAVHNWSGSLSPFSSISFNLPATSSFWGSIQNNNNRFHARIVNVNGVSDNYAYNDSIHSNFQTVDVLSNNFYVQLRTNNAAFETRYDIRDSSGTILFQRNSMTNSTTYRDTFNLPVGCYSLNVYDIDDDGLDFFANNDGTGSLRIGEVGIGTFKIFNPDFGEGIKYNFSLNNTTSVEDIQEVSNLVVYPNPAKDILTVEIENIKLSEWQIYNSVGALMKSGSTSKSDFESWNVNLLGWNSGIYFIQFVDEDMIYMRRFVVTD